MPPCSPWMIENTPHGASRRVIMLLLFLEAGGLKGLE